jgi:hypothetical protein
MIGVPTVTDESYARKQNIEQAEKVLAANKEPLRQKATHNH